LTVDRPAVVFRENFSKFNLWITLKLFRKNVDDFHNAFHTGFPLFFRGFSTFTQTHSPYYGFYENYLYLHSQMTHRAHNYSERKLSTL